MYIAAVEGHMVDTLRMKMPRRVKIHPLRHCQCTQTTIERKYLLAWKDGPLLGTSLMRLCLFWPVRPQGGFRLVYFLNACKCLAAIRTHTFVYAISGKLLLPDKSAAGVYSSPLFVSSKMKKLLFTCYLLFFPLTAQSRSWLMM